VFKNLEQIICHGFPKSTGLIFQRRIVEKLTNCKLDKKSIAQLS